MFGTRLHRSPTPTADRRHEFTTGRQVYCNAVFNSVINVHHSKAEEHGVLSIKDVPLIATQASGSRLHGAAEIDTVSKNKTGYLYFHRNFDNCKIFFL